MEDLGFVHYFEPSPNGKTRNALTLLLLHGTGGDEKDLVPVGRMLSSKANLLSPRGKSIEEGVPRYFRRLAEGVFDEKDLMFRTNELGDFVKSAAEKYDFDLKKVFAVGFSNGANIGASLLITLPELLAGAILFRAMLPYYPRRAPDLHGKSVLVVAGGLDRITPKERVEELSKLLEKGGAKVALKWEPQASHGLTQEDVKLAKGWLESSQRKG